MKTFIVEVMDESKTEFVETLLNEIDGIVVREKKRKASTKKKGENIQSKKKDDLFANSFGMWKDRDIDPKELRKKAWRNR